MRLRRSLALVAVTVLTAGTLATALAISPAGAAAGKDVAPKSGHWIVDGKRYDQTLLKGTFVVTAHHKDVTSLRTTGGAGVENTCGTGVVKVIGKQAIIHVSGTDYAGSYSRWIVGKRTPQASSPFGPKKVTVSHDGHTSKGTLELSFAKANGGSDTFGEISFGKCQFEFGLKRR